MIGLRKKKKILEKILTRKKIFLINHKIGLGKGKLKKIMSGENNIV